MELQWKLRVAMGGLERGFDQGRGRTGERRGAGEQDTARGPQHAGEGGRCEQCQSWTL